MSSAFFLALLAPASALRTNIAQAQSRRAVLGSAAAAVAGLSPLAANAANNCARIEAGGSAECVQSSSTDGVLSVKGYNPVAIDPKRAAIPTVGGKYSDPNHPGCPRRIISQAGSLIVTGADEDKVPFKLSGKVSGKLVTIDFSPKGGPKDLTAEILPLIGLKFPDGNVWTKL